MKATLFEALPRFSQILTDFDGAIIKTGLYLLGPKPSHDYLSTDKRSPDQKLSGGAKISEEHVALPVASSVEQRERRSTDRLVQYLVKSPPGSEATSPKTAST
jgi:hypothetical protein